MQITIAERLKPFIKRSGSYVVLPTTSYRLRIYPTRIEVYDLATVVAEPFSSVSLKGIQGPLEDFTIQQDLEKNEIIVWGFSPHGFLRYRITSLKGQPGIQLCFEKVPEGALSAEVHGKELSSIPLVKGFHITIEGISNYAIPSSTERLSLGSHKKQDWELIHRRCDFSEILPLWHRLGLSLPHLPIIEAEGVFLLLKDCREAIQSKVPESIIPAFKKLYLAAFEGMLSPRLVDSDYQGLMDCCKGVNASSPLALLTEGSKLITSLFVSESEGVVSLLPALPPEFHVGRLQNLKASFGIVDIEWTKKKIRRLEIKATATTSIKLITSGDEKNCRIRTGTKDRGIEHLIADPIELIAGTNYWYDNFTR